MILQAIDFEQEKTQTAITTETGLSVPGSEMCENEHLPFAHAFRYK